jgi:hypothetical protein
MKKLLLAVTLGITFSSFKGNPKKSAEHLEASYSDYAQANSNKDTLYLLENSSLAKMTYDIWKNDPKWNGCNPCIRFVPFGEMKKLKLRLESAKTNAE